MKNRPLIGINADYRATAKGRTPQSFMHSGYYDCLLSAGALPVIIPPLIREHDLTPILDRITAPNRRVLRWLALRGNAARQLRSTGHATSTRSERNS